MSLEITSLMEPCNLPRWSQIERKQSEGTGVFNSYVSKWILMKSLKTDDIFEFISFLCSSKSYLFKLIIFTKILNTIL